MNLAVEVVLQNDNRIFFRNYGVIPEGKAKRIVIIFQYGATPEVTETERLVCPQGDGIHVFCRIEFRDEKQANDTLLSV